MKNTIKTIAIWVLVGGIFVGFFMDTFQEPGVISAVI